MIAAVIEEPDTLEVSMRELDGRYVDADGIGRAYVALQWDAPRDRIYLVLLGDDEEICRCRLEFAEAADAMRHPFFYLRYHLPIA